MILAIILEPLASHIPTAKERQIAQFILHILVLLLLPTAQKITTHLRNELEPIVAEFIVAAVEERTRDSSKRCVLLKL
jgi:hypothetical protein